MRTSRSLCLRDISSLLKGFSEHRCVDINSSSFLLFALYVIPPSIGAAVGPRIGQTSLDDAYNFPFTNIGLFSFCSVSCHREAARLSLDC